MKSEATAWVVVVDGTIAVVSPVVRVADVCDVGDVGDAGDDVPLEQLVMLAATHVTKRHATK